MMLAIHTILVILLKILVSHVLMTYAFVHSRMVVVQFFHSICHLNNHSQRLRA